MPRAGTEAHRWLDDGSIRVAKRGAARARVRALLREREEQTEALVQVAVDARAKIASLAEQSDRLRRSVEDAVLGLTDMGYSRSEIAALCGMPEEEIRRRRRSPTADASTTDPAGVSAAVRRHGEPPEIH